MNGLDTDDRQRSSPASASNAKSCARSAGEPGGRQREQEAVGSDLGEVAVVKSVCIFEMCLKGFHLSCIRYGPLPTTYGGERVVCGCSCHQGQDPDWKPSDADRMATSFAFEYGADPRVDQIMGGEFRG